MNRFLLRLTLLGLLALASSCSSEGPDPLRPPAPATLPPETVAALDGAAARVAGPLSLRLWLGGKGEIRREEMEELTRRLSSSPRVTLTVGDLAADPSARARLEATHGPALEASTPAGNGLAFLGYPAGMELAPFLEALIDLAAGADAARSRLHPGTSAFLGSLRRDISLAVFVSPH